MNGSAANRSSSAYHSSTSVNIGSTSTPRPALRTRTRSPSNLNSRGRRTAWLRPFRNNLAVRITSSSFQPVYTTSLYHLGTTRRLNQPLGDEPNSNRSDPSNRLRVIVLPTPEDVRSPFR